MAKLPFAKKVALEEPSLRLSSTEQFEASTQALHLSQKFQNLAKISDTATTNVETHGPAQVSAGDKFKSPPVSTMKDF